MNIQIFGKSKCFDTKKAERWFKERRIKFQAVDLKKFGMSRGELASVKNAVGLEAMIDPNHPDAALLSYLASDQASSWSHITAPASLSRDFSEGNTCTTRLRRLIPRLARS